ncbi:MAG: CPBP family intramembrane metalloprotease [Anaeromyxobacteraceae bacterium]|nr:CPBP family intramembrane metalloprotease [Anaeromyxobacteraceae bacterium]
MTFLHDPAVAWLLPVPVLLALAPLLHRVFGATWRGLDAAALEERARLVAAGRIDHRTLVAPALGVFVLALQEYFGKWGFFEANLRPALAAFEQAHPGGPVDLATWGGLYNQVWWGLCRVGGYLLPIALWPLLFRGERRLDCGLRVGGLRQHLWIYALALAVMVPLLLVVRRQPDFGAYYPFYRSAGRSWADLLAWEAIYAAQFFALEAFFRGWWLHATRTLGAASILGMVVPYTMIHFGKPWLEVSGAIVAGVVLGSLSARTRSIWAGFLVHATVGLLMDVLSLEQRGALPVRAWPGGDATPPFTGVGWLLAAAWLGALALLAVDGRRAWRARARAR